MGEYRVQAEHGAGASHPDDHLTIFGSAGGQLHIAAADQIKTPGILALGKERSLRRQGDGAGDQLKIGQNGAAQGAEPSGAAVGTGRTTHRNLPGRVLLPRMRPRRAHCLRHGLAPSGYARGPSPLFFYKPVKRRMGLNRGKTAIGFPEI